MDVAQGEKGEELFYVGHPDLVPYPAILPSDLSLQLVPDDWVATAETI